MDVVLPKNSLTMTEADIIEWYVDVGGEVVAGQPLFVMETEKSEVDVEATVSGTLTEIRCRPGTRALAGEVIAVVDTGKDDASFAGAVTGQRAVAQAAVELAAQLGIDIDSVRGSGPGGRVLEEDVLKVVQEAVGSPGRGVGTEVVGHENATPPEVAPPSTASPGQPRSRAAAFSRSRVTGNRSTLWAAAVPTFLLSAGVSFPRAARTDGATVSDLLMAAAARAARQVPVANAFVDDDGGVRLYDDVRVGLLVRDGDALLPLVLADPDRTSLAELHANRRELMAQVGHGALPATATSWPTIVVSNIGRPSVRWFSAVLFPGTSLTIAVAGLGAAQPENAELVLTCDHRVLDGVDAAEFAAAFNDALSDL